MRLCLLVGNALVLHLDFESCPPGFLVRIGLKFGVAAISRENCKGDFEVEAVAIET